MLGRWIIFPLVALGITGCLTPSDFETTPPQGIVITPTPLAPVPALTVIPTPSPGPRLRAIGETPDGGGEGVVPSPTPIVEALPLASATEVLASPTDVPVAATVISIAQPSDDVASSEQYTIDLINLQRTAAGVPALARDEALMGIARGRVADMVARGYMGHTDPVTGEHLFRAMLQAAGYTTSWYGENWYGTATEPPANAEVAMNWFMTDPPHANNILSPNYTAVGVGIAFNGQMWLLVQDFAGE